MPIAPHQVASRANSDLLRIDRVSNQTNRAPAQRMADIVRIADQFRAAVAGSTADPLRGYTPLGEAAQYVPIPGLPNDPADSIHPHGYIPGPVGVATWARVRVMQEPSNLVFRVEIVMADEEIAHYDFADTEDHLRLPYAETAEKAVRLGIVRYARSLRSAVAGEV